jgi:hypothetical protein
MNKRTRKIMPPAEGLMTAPAYPFSARAIFGDLRSRLALQHHCPMSFERLAKMLGKSRSTTYHWFDLSRQPHVLGFLSLLERLSPAQRVSFIEAHCRTYPDLNHPRLTLAPGKAGDVLELLQQKVGLSIVTGGTQNSRQFVFTALGHAATRGDGKLYQTSGIDLRRPIRVVPVESWIYIDGDIGAALVRQLVHKVWTRTMTSSAPRLFFNGVWSFMPEVRGDLMRSAQSKHVFIADEVAPDLRYLRAKVATPIHELTLSPSKSVPDGIMVTCRAIERATHPGR